MAFPAAHRASSGHPIASKSTDNSSPASPAPAWSSPTAPSTSSATGWASRSNEKPPLTRLYRSSAEAVSDAIAREAAAPLAQAFRGTLAPIWRIILDSQSPAEVQQRILALYADWSPDRVQPLIEDALVAHAANGAIINAN